MNQDLMTQILTCIQTAKTAKTAKSAKTYGSERPLEILTPGALNIEFVTFSLFAEILHMTRTGADEHDAAHSRNQSGQRRA